MSEKEILIPELLKDTTANNLSSRVVLFDDDYHYFEDVINQIIKATSVAYNIAEKYTWQVHNTGKCTVYHGNMEECLLVSGVLQEIHLRTEVIF